MSHRVNHRRDENRILIHRKRKQNARVPKVRDEEYAMYKNAREEQAFVEEWLAKIQGLITNE